MSTHGSNDPDKFELYEQAAQNPSTQARFLRALSRTGSAAATLGEDFAGTGAISRAWTEQDGSSRAVCVDIDPEPLERLQGCARIEVHNSDVMDVVEPVDVLAVLNFSICEWHTRDELLRYLRHASARLRAGGTLILDIYGGSDAFSGGTYDVELDPGESRHDRGAVLYQWEQVEADPITARVRNAMHFQLVDGTWIRNAFVYDWRLWSIPELIDALDEIGMKSIEIHNSLGDAQDDDGVIHARPLGQGEALDENYVVYVVSYADQESER